MKKLTLSAIIIFISITSVIFTANLITKPTTKFVQNSNIQSGKIITTTSKFNNIKTKTSNTANSSFTLSQAKQHSTRKDCYLIVKNNVYNVSSYISSHPGGKRNITSRCGTEVTGIFAQIHSNRAWDLLAKYKIGTLTN